MLSFPGEDRIIDWPDLHDSTQLLEIYEFRWFQLYNFGSTEFINKTYIQRLINAPQIGSRSSHYTKSKKWKYHIVINHAQVIT